MQGIKEKRTAVIAVTAIALGVLLFLLMPRNESPHISKYLHENPTSFVRAGEFNIHYLTRGSGTPLILIHGGGAWLYSFRNNIAALSRGHTVYALDMPGHGYTRYSIDPSFDLDMFADVLLDFMDALGLERATLVGHSWGGGWAAQFSIKYPDRVDRLVLIDSSGFDVRDHWEWEILEYPLVGELASRLISEGWVRQSYKNNVFHDPSKVTDELISEVFAPLTFPANRRAQYTIQRRLDWKVTERKLRILDVPTLIIWGREDKYLEPGIAERFGEEIKGSTVVILEDCGHTPHEERPDEVNKLILTFLDGAVPAADEVRE